MNDLFMMLLFGVLALLLIYIISAMRARPKRRIHEDAARRTTNSQQAPYHTTLPSPPATSVPTAPRELESSISELTREVVQRISENLMPLMEERYLKHQQHAEQNLSERHNKIASLVEPIRSSLEEMNRQRQKMETSLKHEYKDVREACHSMQKQFTEIFSKNHKKGAWGEIQLRKIIEMAGLLEHVDFDLQPSLSPGTNKKSRPDALIRLPQNKCLIIDAKAPTEHFVKAREIEHQDTTAFKKASKKHIDNLRTHIKKLSGKSYFKTVAGCHDELISAEFVVMFVPLEGLYALALEEHINLFEEASNQGVILSTPSSLLALMKTVAFIWQEHSITTHSAEINRKSLELMNSLDPLAQHLDELGKNLDKTIRSYNRSVHFFNEELQPCTRDLQNLGVQKKSTTDLQPIERVPKIIDIRKASG